MRLFDFSRLKKTATPGFMLRVSKAEAIQIIQSLSNQIVFDNPNRGRVEHNVTHEIGKSKKQVYFSISVNDEK